jgi:hypothetical protein
MPTFFEAQRRNGIMAQWYYSTLAKDIWIGNFLTLRLCTFEPLSLWAYFNPNL